MTLANIDESTGEITTVVEVTPMQKIVQATEWADALMGVVNSRKLYLEVGGKKYLMVEAWEYKAKVNLVETQTGQKRGGGAIALCGMDEFAVKGQSSTGAKHNACMSMAQTRATSKAYRINFSYVASIGGYAATPAEEMVNIKEETKGEATVNEEAEHWCNIHGAKMFWSDKQQASGFPPSHREGNGYCTGEE